MSSFYGPQPIPLTTSGLLLLLDAANRKSYSGSGTQWSDLSGRTNHATTVASPTYTSQGPGYFAFNGSTQYANIANTPTQFAFNSGSPFTILTWIRLTTATGNFKAVVNSSNSSGQWNYGLYISDTNRLYSGYNGAGNNVGPTLSTAQWYQATLSYTEVGNLHQIYLNGEFQGSLNLGIDASGSQQLSIGRKGASSIDYFPGDVSQVLIYDRALTGPEIRQNFQAYRGRYAL